MWKLLVLVRKTPGAENVELAEASAGSTLLVVALLLLLDVRLQDLLGGNALLLKLI